MEMDIFENHVLPSEPLLTSLSAGDAFAGVPRRPLGHDAVHGAVHVARLRGGLFQGQGLMSLGGQAEEDTFSILYSYVIL